MSGEQLLTDQELLAGCLQFPFAIPQISCHNSGVDLPSQMAFIIAGCLVAFNRGTQLHKTLKLVFSVGQVPVFE